MRVFITSCLCLAVLAACEADPDLASQRRSAETLQCPAGQIPWNFTQFPTPFTAESARRRGDAGVPETVTPPTPVTLRITAGFCAGEESLTAAAGENCNGRTECSFAASNCQGVVQLRYTCSNDPSAVKGLRCDTRSCYFQLKCDQPPAPTTTVAPRVECVPEQCHGATRRDENLQCVSDAARPIEYKALTRSTLSEKLVVFHPTIANAGATPVYPPTRKVFNRVLGGQTLDVDRTGITGLDQGTFNALSVESNLAFYRVLFPETIYDMEYIVWYVVPDGQPNLGLQGNLVLWAYDSWTTRNEGRFPAGSDTYRCQLHTVDMRKYGPGQRVPGLERTYAVRVKERFLVPRDCNDDSGTSLEARAAAGRRANVTLVDFLNAHTHAGTTLAASYGLDDNVIVLADTTESERRTNCAPNPSDFFFDPVAKAVDRVKYLNQRRVPFFFVAEVDRDGKPTGPDPRVPDRVWFRPTNQTHVGVSAVRPKKLVQKIRGVGPARGFIRADIDWFLSGDRQKYWQSSGFTSEREDSQLFLEGFLLPLDANDQPIAEPSEGYPRLGQLRVTKSTAHGVTYGGNYPVTEDLRKKFMTPGSPLYTTADGRKFLLRACLRFGGSDPSGTRSAVNNTYTLDFINRCQNATTPLVIRLDPAVAPLEPLATDPFSEATPQAGGDGRMSQSFDNDVENECVAGSHACRVAVSNGLEGRGAFGGSLFATDVTTTTAADGGTTVHVEKDAELWGFTVMSEEEDDPAVMVAGSPEVSFRLQPPWDLIVTSAQVSFPGLRWRSQQVAGQQGLGAGYSYSAPVRFGLVQGDVVFSTTVGFGLGGEFKYKFGGTAPATCTGTQEDCQELYLLQTPATLRDARAKCENTGGRLADMTSDLETRRVREKVPSDAGVWLGAQAANQYVNAQCLGAWDGTRCFSDHQTHLRWLSNDEDFATSRSFGAFTADSAEIAFDGTPSALPAISVERPTDKGVVLGRSGLQLAPMTASYASVCRFRNTAEVTTHALSGGLEATFGAGLSVAFCTPSEKFGVCLEGGFNIINATLTPTLTYTHHDIKDKRGRTGRQSNLTFDLKWDLVLLSGSLDLRVVFWKYFSFSYNLLTFSGFSLGVGGELYKVEWPLYEELQ